MPELTYNIVYKITNLVNNKIYVGVHKTNDLEDGYMGSGTVLRNAIQKYGIENFNKEILFNFSTYKEALEKEKEIIDEDFLSRNDTYNLRRGGVGGFDFIRKQPDFDKWHQKAVEIGTRRAKIVHQRLLQQRKEQYYLNPKLCEYCGKVLPYGSRNRFCNSSCSAKFNNPRKKGLKHKYSNSKSKRLKYIIKVSNLDISRERYEKSPRLCLYCNKRIPYEKKRQIYCSKSCKSLKQHQDNPLLRFSNPKGINRRICTRSSVG